MSRRPFTLWHGALASLSLHALVAMPWWLNLQAEESKDEQKQLLVIELDGLESLIQQQQQQLGAKPEVSQQASEANPTPPPVAATPAVVAEAEPVTEAPLQAESPVKVEQKPPEPKPVPPTQPQLAQAAPTQQQPEQQPTDAGQKQQQVEQALKQPELSKSALQRYLALLKQSIQGNLEYPEDARRYRQTGTPVVSFRLQDNGQLEPGSLHLARSSGFPQLDQRALAAANASAPFDRPPKGMQVAIAISFARSER
ncbi:TonB family protein [Oceanobacter mangrovi]|uniref:TonB family protein n=1 Tax=Oceanobacter mangrovi TaxID=2862510 RepID=UPI001C8EF34A|nr:TonB family protein [Oceanobacter mangrovi]